MIEHPKIDITKDSFLSADDICTKLSVSKSTFDRWRRNESLSYLTDNNALTPFPQPALKVGGSDRWNADAVNAWLIENKDKRNKRGFFER